MKQKGSFTHFKLPIHTKTCRPGFDNRKFLLILIKMIQTCVLFPALFIIIIGQIVGEKSMIKLINPG